MKFKITEIHPKSAWKSEENELKRMIMEPVSKFNSYESYTKRLPGYIYGEFRPVEIPEDLSEDYIGDFTIYCFAFKYTEI